MADQVPDVYANTLNLRGGAYDVALTFGLQDPGSPDEELPVRPLVTVRMSLALAKVIGKSLSAAIDSYEARTGIIPIPADVQAAVDAQVKEAAE